MSTLPSNTPARAPGGVWWQSCTRCGDLFPAAPGQVWCRFCGGCDPAGRCAAAHPEDASPCQGPRDAVRVVDAVGEQVYGCVHHAAAALASVQDARVYPGSVPGAAIAAYEQAQSRRPFDFHSAPRPEVAPLPDVTPARTPAGAAGGGGR